MLYVLWSLLIRLIAALLVATVGQEVLEGARALVVFRSNRQVHVASLWTDRELHPKPSPCEGDALLFELPALEPPPGVAPGSEPYKGPFHLVDGGLIGVGGFAPPTSSSRTKRATRLRYTPWSINGTRRTCTPTRRLNGVRNRASTLVWFTFQGHGQGYA